MAEMAAVHDTVKAKVRSVLMHIARQKPRKHVSSKGKVTYTKCAKLWNR